MQVASFVCEELWIFLADEKISSTLTYKEVKINGPTDLFLALEDICDFFVQFMQFKFNIKYDSRIFWAKPKD